MKLLDGVHAFFWNSMSANNCNSYLLEGGARVLVDPGHVRLFDHVEQALYGESLQLKDIDLVIATHFHPDHMEAVRLFKDKGVPFAVHEVDWKLLSEVGRHMGFVAGTEGCAPDFFLEEGDLHVKDMTLEIIHTPGHSPGSVSIYWKSRKTLLTGDVVFRDGLGRTDLAGGDGALLKESIRRLATYDVELLLPGHGGEVSGKSEVTANFSRVAQVWFEYI